MQIEHILSCLGADTTLSLLEDSVIDRVMGVWQWLCCVF